MKRLKLFIAALALLGGVNLANAQTVVPFLSEKNEFGGATVSSLSTFVPGSATTYTLELTGCVANQIITVSGGSFSYTPTSSGIVRFVRNGDDVVHVYEGTTYKGTVEVSSPSEPTYPTNLTSASDENLIQNGGFEDTSDGTYSGQSSRWYPTHWNSYKSDKKATGNGTSVRNGNPAMTGDYNMLMHNDGYYLTQQLASGVMKNFTPYQISYSYRANESSQAGAKYKFQVGSEEFKTDYFSSTENKKGTTTVQTYTTTFVTPATIVDQPYVQLYRTGYVANNNNQDLDRFDEFILVAANGGGIGITGATGATFFSGSAFAPEGAFGASTSYSLESSYLTSLVTNGTFDSNANGWTSTTNASDIKVASNQQGAFIGNYYQNWNGSAFTGKMYQLVSDIPNGTYKLKICAFVNNVDASKGQYVYANDNKIYVYTTTPTAYTVYTYVNNHTLDYGLNQDNAVANWIGIDNVSLEYCGASDQTTAGYKSILNTRIVEAGAAASEVSSLLTTIAQAADQSADDVTYQSVVGGSEAAALENAIANANTAVNSTNTTEVQEAATALSFATEAYNAAKPAYERAAMVIAIGRSNNMDVSDLENLVANSETTAAEVEDAANTNISSVVNLALVNNNKTLGFEKDEYAPYNNVEGLQLFAGGTDMAEDPANYENDDIYEQLLAIESYTWINNTGEVNAIAGGAELDSYTHSGNYDIPNGWTNTGYNTRIVGITESLVDNNPGLAGVTNNRAMLLKYGTTYGGEDGYTLPLKANTVYKFSFTYGLWDEDGEIKKDLSVTSPEGNTINMIPARVSKTEGNKENCANKSTDAWYKFETWFKTAEAGNYVLNITNTDGNNQRQMVFAELDLRKANPTDITIKENATEAPAYSYSNVTLYRTLSASYWNTFSVPFDMDIPSGWEVKELDNVDDEDENVINFKTAESIVAGNPYLVKPNSDVTEPKFNGVIVSPEAVTKVAGNYKFAAQIYNKELPTDGTIAYLSTDGAIKKLTSGSIKGLRAYFIIPADSNPNEARIAFTDGDQTGIKDSVRETINDSRVYDLQGRQVKALKKGIYVVNGKKVIK